MNFKIFRKVSLVSAFCIFLISAAAFADRSRDLFSEFNSGLYTNGSIELPYRFAHFNESENSQPILVVFMHGHSAFGKDNSSQLEKQTLKNVVTYIEENSIDAIVLAPQCDEESKWTEIPEILNSFYTQFKKENDCSKIILCGDSMGGCGIWLLLDRFPLLAEKAVVLGAAPFKPNIRNFTKTPVFAVCGDMDDFGSIKRIEPVINKINEAGGKAFIKILKDSQHIETCVNGMSEDVLEFFFTDN